MENKMLMPANYSVMNEEEMTYTTGGAGEVLGVTYGVFSLAVSALAIYNYATGLSAGRKFMKEHKGQETSAIIDAAMDEYVDYLDSSLLHAVRGIHAGLCYVGLWPITLLVLMTA